jgi:hypothetical protein
MTTARSPLARDSATRSASCRQTSTRKKLVWPSRQLSLSLTRAVTARRKVHGGPTAADGGGGDRPNGRPPLQPALQQLGHRPRPRALVPACADLLQQPGLDLLGLAHRGLGLAGDLLADVALAAG